MSPGTQAYFEGLYGASDDPYGLRARWYEERKRALLLAALPRRRYGNTFEPGCGTGEFTAALAQRCSALLASDGSQRAVELAARRTAGLANVRVERQDLPADWPHASAPFDLIVVAELGYFLQPDAMRRLADCCGRSLATDGTLLACDWRHDFDERVIPTAEVHARLEALGLTRMLRYEDDDFLLQAWSGDGRSVAQREKIR